MSRPANTWKCKCGTDCCACRPQFDTTLYPSSRLSSFAATAIASNMSATTDEFSLLISEVDAICCFGMNRMWTGACGLLS